LALIEQLVSIFYAYFILHFLSSLSKICSVIMGKNNQLHNNTIANFLLSVYMRSSFSEENNSKIYTKWKQ